MIALFRTYLRPYGVQLVIVLAVMTSISLWLLRWARRQRWW